MSEVSTGAQMSMGLNTYRGLSAYEIALQNGFEGTEADWLASLQGQDGKTTSVNGVEQIDGDVTITGENIPVSKSDSRKLKDVAADVASLVDAIDIADGAIDLKGKYLDNALFR